MNSWRYSVKKKYLFMIGAVILFVALLTGILMFKSNSTDGAKFKKEYESYNNKATAKGYKYQALKIPKKNKVKYTSLEEAVELIENETATIYFGFPNCPWCRGMLPTLIDKTNKSSVKNLYYVDMTDKRDKYNVNKDGKVEKEQDASDSYYKLLELLDKYLDDYVVTDDEGAEYKTEEKRIFVPLLVVVEDGIVRDAHTGSVELEENQSPYEELNATQTSEMGAIIDRLLEKIEGDSGVCTNEHC